MGLLIIGILGGLAVGALLCYLVLRRRLAGQGKIVEARGGGEISQLLGEIQRVGVAIKSDNWYERGDTR